LIYDKFIDIQANNQKENIFSLRINKIPGKRGHEQAGKSKNPLGIRQVLQGI
jgi:hypothetical protein